MKKTVLGTVVLALLAAANTASAADLSKAPAYKAPIAAPIVYTWTGCYVGGHAGGAWGNKAWTFVNSGLDAGSHNVDGWLAGAQVGCDYQFAPLWVVGVEAQWSWTDIKGSHNGNAVNPPTFTEHTKVDWLGSVTGRLGLVVGPQWLFYGKGGVAWTQDKFGVDFRGTNFTNVTDTRTGWTAGAGVEWQFFPHWSAKLEYDYYFFGTHTDNFVSVVGTPVPVNIKQQLNEVKLGVNWRF